VITALTGIEGQRLWDIGAGQFGSATAHLAFRSAPAPFRRNIEWLLHLDA